VTLTAPGVPLPDSAVPLADERLALRWFVASDAPALVEICRDPEILRWTFMPEKFDRRSARTWIERRDQARRFGRTAAFAVVDNASGALVGQCGIAVDRPRNTAEAFYWVAAPARGRGIASAALEMVVRYAFETLGIDRVELKIDPANTASQGVARATRFTYEGTLRSDQPFKGRRMDSQLWSRLPND
jgi:RimJ/RimL family protein N-acetyltransferase